jgi:hypothetical protein
MKWTYIFRKKDFFIELKKKIERSVDIETTFV